jgi:hypothetical protein
MTTRSMHSSASQPKANNSTKIVLGILTLTGVVGAAMIGTWSKNGHKADSAGVTFSTSGNHVINASGGDHNTYNANSYENSTIYAKPKVCRLPSHGVEAYGSTFKRDETSPWMGGGYDPGKWCNDVIGRLRGEHPGGAFTVLSQSEHSHTTCSPFNCPQYQYFCTVQVQADPVYIEREDSECNKQ